MSSRKGTAGGRTLSLLAVLSLMSALVLFLGQLIAFADPPVTTDEAKITICHRTDSATNPYVEITVAREAADGLAGNSGNEADHFGEHKGPLASSLEVAQDLKDDKIEWGDIIPDVDDDGNAMPHSGLNWTSAGQAMWSAECAFVTPPPTTPPPTTPPPTTPPPTTPPPTTPPPTTPPPTVSVLIEKTNDANEDGIYSNNEQSKNDGLDVNFKLVITNTSDFAVEIQNLTDSFGQTTVDLLVAKCAGLAGVTLDPDESVTCTFTLNNYSPAQGTAIVNVAEVCVEIVGGTQTDCDTNPSRVHTAVVLGQTVTPTPTTGPTRTPPGGIAFTGPESAVPLTALAFALLTLGMGLLWAGNRKRESYER